ncbi:MAG TPA: hypothetical protein VJS43_17690, partial [Candidatus Acidoferrales bacterium]|nr:hypothetical protein [Candidatus Acidoferrales bacterium]
MDKAGKWLVWIGSVLLVLTAFLHLYGYTFTASLFAGTGARADVIGAYRTLSLAFFFTLLLLAPVFLLLSRMPGAKRIALIAVLIPLADLVLMFHFLGLFVGTIAMIITVSPLLLGVLLL